MTSASRDEPGPEEIARMSALIDAGNDAFLRGEYPAAHGLFDRAVEAAAPFARTLDVRTQALINRASAADRLGDHPAAVASFREALGLCDLLAEVVAGDVTVTAAVTVLRASALVNLSHPLLHSGDFDGAHTALEQARALLASPADETTLLGPDTADLLISCLVSLTALTIQREQWARANELATESLDVVLRHQPELAGRPLMNLSAIGLATGRPELAEDFAHQAVTAFQAADTPAGVAEARQSLAQIYLRSGRLDEAEPLLTAGQAFFDRAGMSHQSGIGLDLLGLLAALRGDPAGAGELYVQGVARFEECGAVVAAAEVRVRLAAVLHAEGRYEESEAQLAQAVAAFAASRSGLRCAQADFFHATLLEDRLSTGSAPDPGLLGRAVGLAVPAALAIDAVRFTLANGAQRERWNREIAAPAMRLAFRLAVRAGAAGLVGELIESQCAGTPLMDTSAGDGAAGGPTLEPPQFLGPLTFPDPGPGTDAQGDSMDTFQLGAALADVAASVGLRVSPPPRLALNPAGAVALDPYIAQAEARYGGRVRDTRVVPTW
ncbi:hypothetical protein [Streptomyces sp. NPDC126933]|uniref:hypothetical protein n=1 Tax=unclassified Streptomyces TaxID=2593676 RepID=UPI0036565A95